MKTASTPLEIIIFGLSITSAWGNGHATTYRALARALSERGHRVTFYERDVPWYADNRDLPRPPYARTVLYSSVAELHEHFGGEVQADLVILGSFVPEGIQIANWLLPRVTGLTAFYDIDTPVTVASLDRGECPYLSRELVARFDSYLSFAGGPILERLRKEYGARHVRPFYCSVDPQAHYPTHEAKRYDLGYLGTYSADRQPALERLLSEPARQWPEGRFVVAGPQYPATIEWPRNVERIEHLEPGAHRGFYNGQRFTLNITRRDMVANGFSPSVRLFEAAACGVPIISDEWRGIETLFTPGREILIAHTTEDALRYLRDIDDAAAREIADRARTRVLAEHTSMRRAMELEQHLKELGASAPPKRSREDWSARTVSL